MPSLPVRSELERVIDAALAEDVGLGDSTTQALIPSHLEGSAQLVVREPGVLAGLEVAFATFARVDSGLKTKALLLDGDVLEGNDVLGTVSGCLASIFTAERTALNFLQRMSGIATLTARYVAAVSQSPAAIADTRKTAPGLRALDKYAVATGGGRNHRHSLSDAILIKDNHIAALRAEGVSLSQVVRRARARAPHTMRVEVEVETLEEVREALRGGADILMLDNMRTHDMREAVHMARGSALTEASGGITLDNVAEVASTGVDIISIGALTHSPRALDISLEYDE